MEQQAMVAARSLAEQYAHRLNGGPLDGRLLVHLAMAAYMAGSGVPTDEAVHMVERMAAENLISPVPQNPMYHGLPWLVPGPVSGAPYYA